MPEDALKDFVLDQLRGLGEVECRPMFGGFGLYHCEVFFGILFQERLYLKTDAATRPDYEARGMGPFRPNPRQTLRSYYEVPVEILEDADALTAWARKALARQKKGKRPERKPRRRKNRADL